MRQLKINISKRRELPYAPDYQMWKVLAYRNEMNNEHLAKQLNVPQWIFRNSKETEAHIFSKTFHIDLANVLRLGFLIEFASKPSFESRPMDVSTKEFRDSGCAYYLIINLTQKDQIIQGKKIKDLDHRLSRSGYVHHRLMRNVKPAFWMGILEHLKAEERHYHTINQLGEMNRKWKQLARFDYNFEELLFMQQCIFTEVRKLLVESLGHLYLLKSKEKTNKVPFSTLDDAICRFDSDFSLKLPLCFITQMILKKTDETYPLVDLEMAFFPSGMTIDSNGILNQEAIYGTEEHKEMIRNEIGICLQHAVQMLIRCWIAAGMFEDGLRDYLRRDDEEGKGN